MSKTTTNYTVGVMAYVATFGIVGYVLRKLMKLRKNNKKLPTLAELQAKGVRARLLACVWCFPSLLRSPHDLLMISPSHCV